MIQLDSIEWATPIDDISDLIPKLDTQEQLNEWEATNIAKAIEKYLTIKKSYNITAEWIKKIHKEMFDDTWGWAGKYRTKNTNVGVDSHKIGEEIKKLVDDINYWKENKSHLSFFEQSVRIHHRLVFIHPFPNGNGRHARLVSDIFLFSLGENLPTWPDENLIKSTDVRAKYIKALQEADKGNYKLLKDFTEKLIKD